MWTKQLLLPIMSLLVGVHADDWNETYPIERTETVYEVKLSEEQVCINCTAGRSGSKQIRISEIPHFFNGCITTFAIQGCVLPDDSLQRVMDALGVTSASSVNMSDVPSIRSVHLVGVRADAVHVERSELTSEAFNQQPQWRTIEVFNSKIDLLNTSITGSTNLEILKLIKCNITHIPLGMFRSMPQLKHLNLRENLITQITSSNLEGLQSLSVLDLSGNLLKSIPGTFLQFMPNLEELYVNINLIEQITSDALQGTNLIKLYLNNSLYPLSLAPRALANMPRLELIDFTNSGIDILPEDLLQNTINLTHLYLSNNLICQLPPNFFTNQTNLYLLDLDDNLLLEIQPALFLPLRGISQLILDNNDLKEISKNTFSSMHHLQYLSIMNNGLHTIPSEAFPDRCGITDMYLNGNALTTLEMPLLPKLITLDLQENLFTSIPSTWRESLPKLENLYLNKNLFTQLTASDVTAVSHCKLLDISDNMVTYVMLEENTAVPDKILLHGAPLHCDCHMHAYAMMIQKNRTASEAVCVEPAKLNNTKISSVPLSDLICHLDTCPNSCKCMIRPVTKTLEIECKEPLTMEQFRQLQNNTNMASKVTISYPFST